MTITLTTSPDTVPGQLAHEDLSSVELKYSRAPIQVSQYDLWWDQG